MASGPHNHWNRYHVRIVPPQLVDAYPDSYATKEKLQLICIDDGEIFHEVDIKPLTPKEE